ncbi:MAG TPA: tetratricopeptide repeat protein [Ignavibacteria bacterium]|nr:tetratricopeptide repeat protein [Ignavibacteria bacterium]
MNTFNELFLTAYNFFTDSVFDMAVTKLDEAEKVYSPSDQNEFSLEDLYILRGTSKFSQRKFDDAKKDFEIALETNPNSSEACLGLGKYFLVNGLEDNAKVMFEWAVKNNPSHPGAQNALTEINVKLGFAEDDNSLFADDSAESPEGKDNYFEEASDLFVQKRFSEAIEKLTIAKKEHTVFLASIENFIAFNYLGLQKIVEAEKSVENALSLNPFSSQAYATLGEIELLKNNTETAKDKFNLALSYNNENTFAKQGLQKVENMLNRSAELDSLKPELENIIDTLSAK